MWNLNGILEQKMDTSEKAVTIQVKPRVQLTEILRVDFFILTTVPDYTAHSTTERASWVEGGGGSLYCSVTPL